MKMIEIPIFATSDCDTTPIGKLTVDADLLPAGHKFCFGLAYRYEKQELELLYVFPVSDSNYFEFLKKEGTK